MSVQTMHRPMANNTNASKPGYEQQTIDEQDVVRRMRICLYSNNVKSLEKAARDLSSKIFENGNPNHERGIIRLPTKVLRITTRKSPCGEGSKTYDTYQMRIHKRCINLAASKNSIRNFTSFQIDPGVEIEITIQNETPVRRE